MYLYDVYVCVEGGKCVHVCRYLRKSDGSWGWGCRWLGVPRLVLGPELQSCVGDVHALDG